MLKTSKKTAIVLFNLGGPDKLDSVKHFLFNLFSDKFIINLPRFFRLILAYIISRKRDKVAREIYSKIGGKSPLLKETIMQANALKKNLSSKLNSAFDIFICMRHWHPMSDDIMQQIVNYSPSEIILLPLYPQFSTTTTLSSMEDFTGKVNNSILKGIDIKCICCYPTDNSFINSHVRLISKALSNVNGNCRILFSAHGLPKKIIESGDPYQIQIEMSVKHILSKIDIEDYRITFQSRVGPLEWIKPNTEDEIRLACEDGKNIIIVPISFVSEHVETLVELDMEYKDIADKYNVNYTRVPSLRMDSLFIESLSGLVKKAISKNGSWISSGEMNRICPSSCKKCPSL